MDNTFTPSIVVVLFMILNFNVLNGIANFNRKMITLYFLGECVCGVCLQVSELRK